MDGRIRNMYVFVYIHIYTNLYRLAFVMLGSCKVSSMAQHVTDLTASSHKVTNRSSSDLFLLNIVESPA